MRFLKKSLIVLGVFYLLTPLILNNYKLLVNRKDILLFLKTYSHVSQLRTKNLLFLDGRLDGFVAKLEPLHPARRFCEKSIECSYDPGNTAYRIRMLREIDRGEYFIEGNVSFIGKMKDGALEHTLLYEVIKDISGTFAENVSAKEEFRAIVRNKRK